MAVKNKTEILPLQGLPNIPFGSAPSHVEFVLGPPEEIDETEALLSDDIPSLVYYYWDLCLTFFFDTSGAEPFLIMIETDDLDALLLEKKVFRLKPPELISLIASEKIYEYEKEAETWGQTRYSWDEWNIDFYYEDSKLETITWGARMNDEFTQVELPE